MERIEADVLIPGRGEPIRNACVDRVPAVMPGMWDCHGHLMGIRSANVEETAKTSLPVMAARAVNNMETGLMAGFTSVRDLVGLGVHLARVVDEGTIPGPHIYGGGAMLSPTAGHGDLHMFPTSYVHALGASGHYFQICDGVDECLRGVRNQLRLGARVIKLCASGGVMSEVDHPEHQQSSDADPRPLLAEAPRPPPAA